MKFLFLLILVCICCGCSIPIFTDISKEIQFIHLIKHCLELKEDVFLIYYTDSKKYSLEPPGLFSSQPRTVEAYYTNPNGWGSIDKIMGVVPKGTRIFIYKIVEKSTLQSNFLSFYAKINDPRYSHLDIDISFLLNRNYSQQKYSLKERYLEYCEE